MNRLKKSFYGITVEFASDIRYHDYEAVDTFEEYLTRISRVIQNKNSKVKNNIYVVKITDIYFLSLCNFNDRDYFSLIKAPNGIRANDIKFVNSLNKREVASLLPEMGKACRKLETIIDNRQNGKYNGVYKENIINYWLNYLAKEINYVKPESVSDYEK